MSCSGCGSDAARHHVDADRYCDDCALAITLFVASEDRETLLPSDDEVEAVATFERTAHESGEWRARLDNLARIMTEAA